jgi:hypothetical protein
VDLAFDEEDLALAAELRQWLAEHWSAHGRPGAPMSPPADLGAAVAEGQRWQAELAAAGWVGVDWPLPSMTIATTWRVILFGVG